MLVARTRKVKVILRSVLPDIRESVALFEGYQSSPSCPFRKMKVSLKRLWNDTGRGNTKCWEQNLSHGLTKRELPLAKYIRFHFLFYSKHITSTIKEQLACVTEK
jgi:hypothetical protein